MSTLSLPNAAMPAAALAAADIGAADELFSLPAWLYRSEAFAEDLPLPAAPLPALAEVSAPRRRHLSGLLYLATLVMAVAASLPGAITA